MINQELEQLMNADTERFEALSDQVWEVPELKFQEVKSSKLLEDFLENEGFTVERSVAGLPTAFTATYGSGSPVIGILGEYDALPKLGQEAGVAYPSPIVPGGPGHGCGHNLLGVAGVEAVAAIKKQMEAGKLSGTIRYFGCPAEEGGSGKVMMARAGLFEPADICLTWHPSRGNSIFNATRAAIIVDFKFEGKAAHAGTNPWDGRSALDALELMNIGIQFLREHVKDGIRMQYSITDAGGPANVVPETAAGSYVVRAPHQEDLVETYQRVIEIARGAAIMTGTKVSYRVRTQYGEFVKTPVLDELILRVMQELPPIDFSVEDYAEADRFVKVGRPTTSKLPLDNSVNPRMDLPAMASTDAADVSWFVPVGMFIAATWVVNGGAHSWVATATGKSGFAKKGMHFAAKVMAQCATELMTTPKLVQQVKKEHQESLGGKSYTIFMKDEFETL